MATSNKQPYLTATVLDQNFLDDCHDNLVNQLEMIVDIETDYIGTLHLSDRNKYVGDVYYEARLVFPIISRTVGEYLSPTLEFSQLSLEINNYDGYFNNVLASGADFGGWIGKRISVKIGLRDVASTYKEIFSGTVTDQGGLSRSIGTFTLVARSDFERINVEFPKTILSQTSFPNIEPEVENTLLPVIYGDWTVAVQEGASSIPAYVVNGNSAGVIAFTDLIEFVISENDNSYFDTGSVYLLRSEKYYSFQAADVVDVVNNRTFNLRQKLTATPSITLVDDALYEFKAGDKFFCKVRGKDLGSYDDNIIEQARDILLSYTNGAVSGGDFDSSWDSFRDKSTPAESAIVNIKSRIWVQEAQPAMTYVLSLLEQVRLEAFVDRNLKLKINSLHLDNFIAYPTHPVKNWDVVEGSFSIKIDDRNNFNRAKAAYNFLPNRNENFNESAVYKNAAAILQAGKEISKKIVFPNLYEQDSVVFQLKEILKITSAYLETIDAQLTWRSLLLDIGDFVRINVSIQGTQFFDVPAMIREIGYDPQGIKIPVKLWSFQMVPFPGYAPTFTGITGGTAATIAEET